MGTYGRFDESTREYVFTRPVTPVPWINYLSNGTMGAFVSQGAGGVSWYGHPSNGRISRYHFMGVPVDRPGFYVYIRHDDGTTWNPSYQPCQHELDHWEARHGMGTSRYIGTCRGIEAELSLFVPPDDNVLVMDLRLHNRGEQAQKLFISNYVEFSLYEYYREVLGWCVLRNQVRFQYDTDRRAIRYAHFVYGADHTHPVFATCTADESATYAGFDCNRVTFIGRGRGYDNPVAVERAEMSGSELPGGGFGIAAQGYSVCLEPGGRARLAWTLGAAPETAAADALIQRYHDFAVIDQGREDLARTWDDVLSTMHVQIDDPEVRSMINTWTPYGATTTFHRDRDISFDIPGMTAGIRFRDSMQNAMSVCTLRPEMVRPRLEMLFSHQRQDGSTLDSFLPGTKGPVSHGEPRCDNPVWAPMTVYQYVAETGDESFLDVEVPWYDGGKAPIYDHLMAGLKQVSRDRGEHGLPLLKGRDWDDHLALFAEEGAESVMTAQNWVFAARRMQELCALKGRTDDREWLQSEIQRMSADLNEHAWDGRWYRQVLYRGDRTPLGSADRRENKLYINTQSWAVLSGTAPGDRAVQCMEAMREMLDTPYGLRMLVPPYTGIPEPDDPLVSNGPGLGENGGVFVQTNCWAIMAEAVLGRGRQAWQTYLKVLPPKISERIGPDLYTNEAYMFSSHLYAEPDGRRGMANISWLTGSVNWMYVLSTQYLLGIRPTLAGLVVDPVLDDGMDGFEVTRRWRGATYTIKVRRGDGPRRGLTVDGSPVEGRVLSPAPAGSHVHVDLVL